VGDRPGTAAPGEPDREEAERRRVPDAARVPAQGVQRACEQHRHERWPARASSAAAGSSMVIDGMNDCGSPGSVSPEAA
jgi:hypothetical protein